jgi:hypothetical protein
MALRSFGPLYLGRYDVASVDELKKQWLRDKTNLGPLHDLARRAQSSVLLTKVNALATFRVLAEREGNSVSTNVLAVALPTLTGALNHSDQSVLREALFGLKALGGNAAPAQTAVRNLFKSPDHFVREAATNCLRNISPVGVNSASMNR